MLRLSTVEGEYSSSIGCVDTFLRVLSFINTVDHTIDCFGAVLGMTLFLFANMTRVVSTHNELVYK